MTSATIPIGLGTDLAGACLDVAHRARQAASILATVSTEKKNRWLQLAADAILQRQAEILSANERDVARAREADLTTAQIDRLKLTPDRLKSAALGLREIAVLPDPVAPEGVVCRIVINQRNDEARPA